MRAKDNKIILEHEDAVLLSLKGRKFASLSPEEVERISEEEQNKRESSH
ncbi:hypothetical protein [Metallosphaera hakonensis]|nr:hypothetical protein [Metallosphaera hakonensis]